MAKIYAASYKYSRIYTVYVDDEDYEELNKYNWYVSITNNSYYAVAKHGTIYMHKLIIKTESGQMVDHIDGDGLNNRRSNLRVATNSQNQANSQKTRGSSIYKGVSWSTQTSRWRAMIGIGQTDHGTSRVRSLGYFFDEEEAAKAYDRAALALWGEFARLNFPQERSM